MQMTVRLDSEAPTIPVEEVTVSLIPPSRRIQIHLCTARPRRLLSRSFQQNRCMSKYMVTELSTRLTEITTRRGDLILQAESSTHANNRRTRGLGFNSNLPSRYQCSFGGELSSFRLHLNWS